ncbi:hypothetical protein GH741_02990 [Aquibacillus halophilus]|uniref:Histidine kinase n=1 Tax=Aquibacillus halophilus TaxID=930132 RepID=A0A6A8DFK8_9BACI|nr:hypothetical protein [Aquibacillus halophilus]MRH41637.1 hypothetical protein [Aquibacillus halophilus]
MDNKKLHLLIILISYPITVLHFIFGDYTIEKLISGISFFLIVTVIYVGVVYLFFKNDIGRKLVMCLLILIGIISILLAITTA